MIEKKLIVEAVRRAPPGGWKVAELATEMGLSGPEKHRLRRLLDEMLDAGEMERAVGARYRLPGAAELVVESKKVVRRQVGKAKPGAAPRTPTPPPRKAAARPAEAAAKPAEAAPARKVVEAAPTPSRKVVEAASPPSRKPVEAASPPSRKPVETTAKAAEPTRRVYREPPAAAAKLPAPEGVAAPSDERPTEAGGIVGLIRVHPAGYGFVVREDGEGDVFVPARFRGTALDGDKVKLSTWMGHKGTEGKVETVLARGRAKLTGILRREGNATFLEPDDPRIAGTWGRVVLEDDGAGARPGLCVVAEITRYPTGRSGSDSTPLARVFQVLGEPDDPRTEVVKIIAIGDIPDTFPEDALAAAKRTSQELRPVDFADRVDLRDRPFLTIDPETARDFDDAICVEERGKGFRIWVAIADVSHYVTPGSSLDREALIRGCSVYLPDRAIPMLPHELSSGICSINPEVDRCAMVVRMDVDEYGAPLKAHFCAAVIKSHARLDYPGVAAALGGDFRGPRARYLEWLPDLTRMYELSIKMRKTRMERGALDFDLDQPAVVLDEDDPKRVRDVRRQKANPEVKKAYSLVEEYMLAANEAVARYFREKDADTLWRVHDKPKESRLAELAELLKSFGVDFKPEDGKSPKAMKALMADMKGKPYERALHYLMLRSLKQAVYDVTPIGHYGLASTDYLHFTSPIRRYPDLMVHRLLKWHLRTDGEPAGGTHAPPPPREALAQLAADCSKHERRASEAEREVVDMYRAYLMRDRIGEELDGTISGVQSFGCFVECDTPYVEGLIKTENLGESMFFDDKHMRLTGRRSGVMYRLGDRVRVRVDSVSVARRRVDLSLVSAQGTGLKPEVFGDDYPKDAPPPPPPPRVRRKNDAKASRDPGGGRDTRRNGRDRDSGRGGSKGGNDRGRRR